MKVAGGPVFFFLLQSLLLSSAGLAEELLFEAEHANAISSPFRIEEETSASGKLVLACPQNAGRWVSEAGRGLKERGSVGCGEARYHFRLKESGRYWLHLRAWWMDGCSNSCSVALDGEGAWKRVGNDRLYRTWHWVSTELSELRAGEHTLSLFNAEDGVKLDALAISSSAEPPEPGRCLPGYLPGKGCSSLPPAVLFAAPSSEFIFPQESTPLWLYLRNNELDQLTGRAHLSAPPELEARPEEVRFSSEEALLKLPFALKLSPEAPRREYELYAEVELEGRAPLRTVLRLARPAAWFVLGAFPRGEESFSPLARADLRQVFPPAGHGREATWKTRLPREFYEATGFLNLAALFGERGPGSAYLFTCLRSPAAGDYVIQLMHDDACELYLNDRKLYRGASYGPATEREVVLPATWRAGKNKLMLRLTQEEDYWHLRLRIRGPDGAPAPLEGLSPREMLQEL